MKFLGALLFSLTLLSNLPSYGQTPALPETAGVLRQAHVTSPVNYPQLYNGPEYVDYARRYHASTGHQFFLQADKQPGSVHYNGHLFSGLRLAYDVVLDQIVLTHLANPLTLRLINEQVRGFSLENHQFVRLVADSCAGGVINTGYFEMLLQAGNLQLLAKHSKTMLAQPYHGFLDVVFIASDKLFLQKQNVYYAISSKAALIRLLADRKPELQQYIDAQQLRFNKDNFALSATRLVDYYASLLPR